MNNTLLSVKKVSKAFGQGVNQRHVLADVNLDVQRGEFVAIVGYSGSGKTTLISLLAGLTRPDAGSIHLNGHEIKEPSPAQGVVFQNYSLLPWLTVFGNIQLAVDQVFSDWPAKRRQEHVLHYMRMVNLEHARDRLPAQLSGGMRQRVSLARALAMNPEILLLDEPLSALDALTRATLQDEIEKLWEQDRKTVVMITNHVDEALLLADRIIPLTAGPGATLGPSFAVDLDRPRDRQMLNHDRRFHELRTRVTEFLMDSRNKRSSRTMEPADTQPSFEPIDLGGGRLREPELVNA